MSCQGDTIGVGNWIRRGPSKSVIVGLKCRKLSFKIHSTMRRPTSRETDLWKLTFIKVNSNLFETRELQGVTGDGIDIELGKGKSCWGLESEGVETKLSKSGKFLRISGSISSGSTSSGKK